jgi:hypothetical protein
LWDGDDGLQIKVSKTGKLFFGKKQNNKNTLTFFTEEYCETNLNFGGKEKKRRKGLRIV